MSRRHTQSVPIISLSVNSKKINIKKKFKFIQKSMRSINLTLVHKKHDH